MPALAAACEGGALAATSDEAASPATTAEAIRDALLMASLPIR
jgi:hypothetical protein